MSTVRPFTLFKYIDPDAVQFTLGVDKQGKTTISMTIGCGADVAFVSPPCVTQWPRCTGDGNYGTMWGPQEITKAKFTLDLTNLPISGDKGEMVENSDFIQLQAMLETIDDKLLEFVFQNQLRVLSRKNLSKEECKMLQIRSVRAKYDKVSGVPVSHYVQLNTPKFTWAGGADKKPRDIIICNFKGEKLVGADVRPGDIVSAGMYASQVYTGVGGDKFGIQWSFQHVAILCQQQLLPEPQDYPMFRELNFPYAAEYVSMDLSEPVAG